MEPVAILLRRVLGVCFLGVGGALMLHSWPLLDLSPRRGMMIIALCAGAMLVSVIVFRARPVAIRPWLRNVAVAVGGMFVLMLVLLRWYVREEMLPELLPSARSLRETLLQWEQILLHLLLVVGYLSLAVAFIPCRSVRAHDEPRQGGDVEG